MTKMKCIRQHDATDCAAACAAIICLFYGKETTISKLRDIAGTDLKGTTVKGLVSSLEMLGFTAKAVRVDNENFKSKYTLPAIAHIITNEGLSHFVVVHKIKKNYILIADPAKGLLKKKYEDFFNEFDGVLILVAPTSDFEKGKINTGAVFSRFAKLLTPQKGLFITAIVASTILTVLGVVSSFFNKILIDEILPYNLNSQLLIFVIGFGIVGLLQIVLSAIRQHILLYLSQKIDIPLTLGYFKHIYSLPMKFFGTRKIGDILTRFSDSSTIKNVLSSISLSAIIDVTLTIVSGLILYFMNRTLFTVVIILALISAILIYVFKKPYKDINIKQMEQGARLSSQIIESLRGIETVKSYGVEEDTLEKLENKFIGSLRIAFKEGVLSNIQSSFSGAISSIGNMVLMFLGATMVMKGDITLGSLMAFTSLTSYFMGPLGRLIGLQLQIQEASIAMKRIGELYEIEEEQTEDDHKIKVDSLKGDIILNDIVFRYGSRSPVLKNVSMNIQQGKKIALVGESGSGKTTIAKLLLGLWKPEEGNIIINNYDINELDLHSLRNGIAYVAQNVELFSETIADNIKLGNKTASYDDVKFACQRAGCDEFIEKLPSKYGTFLEEAGQNLSGGEKQRLALARALIKKPDILILDEATSNLDFISEAKIYDTLFNKKTDMTMLIIAHRLSTIRKCDEIYVLDKGKIVEHGTHERLLESQGTYFKIWNSQVGEDKPEIIDENSVGEQSVSKAGIDDENIIYYK